MYHLSIMHTKWCHTDQTFKCKCTGALQSRACCSDRSACQPRKMGNLVVVNQRRESPFCGFGGHDAVYCCWLDWLALSLPAKTTDVYMSFDCSLHGPQTLDSHWGCSGGVARCRQIRPNPESHLRHRTSGLTFSRTLVHLTASWTWEQASLEVLEPSAIVVWC